MIMQHLSGVLLEKHPESGRPSWKPPASATTSSFLFPLSLICRTCGCAGTAAHPHARSWKTPFPLYGFLTQDEKALFEKLIGVQRNRPYAGAVKILSGLAAPDLINFIRRGEIDRLVRIPGIGKENRRAHGTGTARQAAGHHRRRTRGRSRRCSVPRRSGCAFGAAQLGLREAAEAEAAVRKAKAGGGGMLEFEPLFRRSLELVR